METFERRVRVVSGDTRLPRADVQGDIAFEDVHFRYPTSNPILLGIDFSIPARSTVAFVGTTGAGKSTIIKLLLRFYDVQEGRVVVDGRDVRELRLEELRTAIGLVSQDAYLFSGSIYENIAYGRPSATTDEIVAAARDAEALEFIERLPKRFNTTIGERGVLLSGGQRQRLAIARALLRRPAIFVFDEATSALDSETEAAVQRSIAQVSAGHTTILIAHRLATVRRADQINVLSDGQIVERGAHDDLLRLGGVYASMWRAQTGEPSVAHALVE
jgi:ATP-binding cassette subfamily B protein